MDPDPDKWCGVNGAVYSWKVRIIVVCCSKHDNLYQHIPQEPVGLGGPLLPVSNISRL